MNGINNTYCICAYPPLRWLIRHPSMWWPGAHHHLVSPPQTSYRDAFEFARGIAESGAFREVHLGIVDDDTKEPIELLKVWVAT